MGQHQPHTRARDPASAGIDAARLLLAQGAPADAADFCVALLAKDPANAPVRILLACALLAEARDWAAAAAAAEAALALAPQASAAHFVRGTALHALGRFEEAVVSLRQATTLAPKDAAIWCNYGNALSALDRLAEAEAALRRACALDATAADPRASLGAVLVQRLRLPQAIAAYTDALRLRPGWASVRWDLGFARLLGGDLSGGFAEWRQRKPEEDATLAARGLAGPEWDGKSPAGRLLACSSQGLGDAIQFARYLPLLAARGARVSLACDRSLAPLLGRLDGVADVVTPDQRLPPHDAWVALSSLPRLFATAAETIPVPAGYLTADPARMAAWRAEWPAERPSVGLVWAGNPAHGNDARRSMKPSMLAPLLARTDVRWVSLQIGGPLPASPRVSALGPRLTDFGETAAALTALDLVITVDTATAHLAGALGRPAWVALPHAPDWRWQLDRADSPWYRSLLLFRQPRPGDWAGVVADLSRRLATIVR